MPIAQDAATNTQDRRVWRMYQQGKRRLLVTGVEALEQVGIGQVRRPRCHAPQAAEQALKSGCLHRSILVSSVLHHYSATADELDQSLVARPGPDREFNSNLHRAAASVTLHAMETSRAQLAVRPRQCCWR